MGADYETDKEILLPEDMNDIFYQVRGDQEELIQLYNVQIYIDSYFQRIRICSRADISGRIETLSMKYLVLCQDLVQIKMRSSAC